MLSKLLRHEFRATGRIMLPVYALLLVSCGGCTLFGRLLGRYPESTVLSVVQTVFATLFGVTTFGMLLLTLVLMVYRFYKNLMTDEGYLMFTLPVSVSQHILSKAVMALVMGVLSFVAALVSIDLLSHGMSVGQGFVSLLRNLSAYPSDIPFMLEGILWFVLTALACVLFIYLCIALGHLAKKHRLLMAFVWYFVLSTAVQVIGLFVMMASAEKTVAASHAVLVFLNGMGAAGVHVIMLTLCLVSAAAGAVCFAGTRYILVHKLNLE